MTLLRSSLTIIVFLGASAFLANGAAPASTLTFPHSIHVEDNGIECEVCHEGVAASRNASEDLRPGMDLCGDCHDVETEDQCSLCHLGPGDPQSYAAQRSKVEVFDHQTHLGRGLDCASCHEARGAEAVRRAAMGDCRSCHATQASLEDCDLCHTADPTSLAPRSHGPGWTHWHGLESRASSAECESCHTQSDCQQCHSGDNIRPRVHPTGFEYRHALDAQISSLDCESCHVDREFCSSCHADRGVLPENHSFGDWAMATGDGGRHSLEAQMDLESCLLCHEDGGRPVCARCHGDR